MSKDGRYGALANLPIDVAAAYRAGYAEAEFLLRAALAETYRHRVGFRREDAVTERNALLRLQRKLYENRR